MFLVSFNVHVTMLLRHRRVLPCCMMHILEIIIIFNPVTDTQDSNPAGKCGEPYKDEITSKKDDWDDVPKPGSPNS